MEYTLIRNGLPFGDNLLAGWMCLILNEHGIPTGFHHARQGNLDRYLDLPLMPPISGRSYEFSYVKAYEEWKTTGLNLMDWSLANFCERFGIEKQFSYVPRLPVKYHDIPGVSGADVAINTRCGGWVAFRQWPYFEELCRMLTASGISFVILEKLRDVECLNAVKKSRLFVGLETGLSHYVSGVVNDALIIQSGFTDQLFWNLYGYECITHPTECTPCLIRPAPTGKECPYGIPCMNEISAHRVFERIREKLSG